MIIFVSYTYTAWNGESHDINKHGSDVIDLDYVPKSMNIYDAKGLLSIFEEKIYKCLKNKHKQHIQDINIISYQKGEL